MKHVPQTPIDLAAVHAFHVRTIGLLPELSACGSPAWVALPDDDPRKLAALMRAGLCWITETALLPRTLADELAAADIDVRARLKAMSVDVAGAMNWSAAADRITRRREFEDANPWAKRVSA